MPQSNYSEEAAIACNDANINTTFFSRGKRQTFSFPTSYNYKIKFAHKIVLVSKRGVVKPYPLCDDLGSKKRLKVNHAQNFVKHYLLLH